MFWRLIGKAVGHACHGDSRQFSEGCWMPDRGCDGRRRRIGEPWCRWVRGA
ncbi:hypothetical protein HMPREF9565_00603 [Cutibacterium acnes HL053PA2]|nr:hypothetical protein HMPREF9616_01375 [Cutibacterium acnes HL007PA1]EFS77534.1 hypothetical protein HMPREF9591_00641 [Cutibacterium acnes HL086PA1]EFT07660.1 hypothetical protein HMPREF9618_01327 [Cutibacterium acnes HL082PA1]EFT51152.1 hypothetical protein HMPREF9565_00603 [Cutibacterium acnes HL053PA2]EGE91055.1 hypothetical protein HMPREF9570_02129 [Cutibacterium acnes HL043PA1]EGF75796.1 hypothetical protein HMPREF9343_00017 [Cutibacterium acnes HL099PA1]